MLLIFFLKLDTRQEGETGGNTGRENRNFDIEK